MTFWKNIMLEETYFKVNRLYCDAPRTWISQQPLCLKTYRLGISFYQHGLLSEAPLLSLTKFSFRLLNPSKLLSFLSY